MCSLLFSRNAHCSVAGRVTRRDIGSVTGTSHTTQGNGGCSCRHGAAVPLCAFVTVGSVQGDPKFSRALALSPPARQQGIRLCAEDC